MSCLIWICCKISKHIPEARPGSRKVMCYSNNKSFILRSQCLAEYTETQNQNKELQKQSKSTVSSSIGDSIKAYRCYLPLMFLFSLTDVSSSDLYASDSVDSDTSSHKTNHKITLEFLRAACSLFWSSTICFIHVAISLSQRPKARSPIKSPHKTTRTVFVLLVELN